MERKTSTHTFLIGFVLALALVGWWLWQRRQEERPAFAPEASRPARRAGDAADAPADSPADSLQEIRGIGATYARRLRAAGIRTFADLAALTPEKARALAQAQSGLADTADWIEQARALAASS